MQREVESVLSEATLMAFIQVVRRHPDATLNEVFKLAEYLNIGDVTLGVAFFDEVPRTGKDWAKKPKAIAATVPELRTAAGREEYDARVLGVLKSKADWSTSQEVREASGGDPHQVRASLNRLIQSGRVHYKGRARGTRYKAA